MADNNTFNAKVVGVVDIENQEAVKALKELLGMQKTLTDGFTKTAQSAVEAFDEVRVAITPSDKQLEKLQKALTEMRNELQQIQLVANSGKVLNIKNEDVQQALELEQALKKISKAYDSIQNQKKIEAGTFGLDQKTSTKAVSDLKRLEEVAKSVQFALSKAPDDAGLKKYHADIEANTAALTKHIDKLREQMTLEKAHDIALRANAGYDKRIQATRQGLNDGQAVYERNQQLAVRKLNERGTEEAARKANLAERDRMVWRQKANDDEALRQNQLLGKQANWKTKVYGDEDLRQNLLQGKQEAWRLKVNADQELLQNKTLGKQMEWRRKENDSEDLRRNKVMGELQNWRKKQNDEEDLRQNKRLGQQDEWRKRMDTAEELRKNLALKRQEDEQKRLATSGRAQYNQGANQLDESNLGRSAAGFRLARLQQTTVQQANPVYQAQDYARRQRAEQERLLGDVYRNANAKPEVSGFYRLPNNQSGDPARVQAAETILNLQRQLVDLQRRGTLTEEESLRLRTQISQEIAGEIVQRNKAGNLEAQQRQAERNMARVRGTGGASLLAVQATLMANYALLNGFTGAVRTAIGSSIELEAELKNVQAVTGTTNTEMVGLKGRIEEVASASKFTSSEVAQAALTLGQAGLSAKQVGQAIGSVATLASASGTSLSQSVDLVTAVIGVFDKTALDMDDVANKISQAANSSKVSVQKLALGFQYAGNIAAQSGISFEETTAAMSAMANAGIRSGSTMGTGLRQFLVETQKPSAEFLATISRIGLTMQDLDFKSHGLVGVARRLRDAGFIASDAIRSFDVRGAAAFNALIANPDDLQRQYTQLMGTKSALRANEIQMDSLKSQATRLSTSLENLAAVGFQPMSALLQKTAEKTANVVIWMTEHEKTVKVLGSTLAAVATTAMALHISSLVKGAVAMLSWTTAAGEATKATTLLSASQATWAGLKATWVGLETTVMTVGVAFSRVAREGLTAAERWAVGTSMVGNELKLLWATCLESPLLPLVAVIGAAAAAFYLLSDSNNKAKEEIDKARASVNDAKSAYEDKAKAVESLNSKISELNYKQKDTKSSNEELQNTVMSLNSQFGGLGLSIDSNTKSYAEMIGKMREVRGEMEQMALAKLRIAQDENRKLEVKQQAQTDQDYGTLKSSGSQAVDTALKHKESLSKDQITLLTNFKGQLQAGNPNLTTAESARSIIDTLAQELKSKGVLGGGIGGYGAIEKFDKTVKALDTYIRSASDLQATKAEGTGLQLTRVNTEAGRQYRQKTFQVEGKAMPLEAILDTFGGNMRAKAPASGDTLKDYDKFYELSEKELASLDQVKEQLVQDQHNPKMNQSVVSNALANVRGLMEGIKSDVRGFAAETDPKAKRDYDNESRRLKALAGSKNKNIAAAAIRDQAALDKKYKTRAIVDPDEKYNAESSIEDAGNIKAQNKLDSADKADRTADILAGIKERAAKAREAALIRAAEADKQSASVTQDIELVQQYWDDGLAKLKEARGMAMKALNEQHNKDKAKFKGKAIPAELATVWKSEEESINSQFDQQIRQFTDSFKGFGQVVGLTLRKMEDAINRRKQDIQDEKVAGEDRVYASSARLRELEMVQALGKRAKDKTFQTTTSYDYGTTEKNNPQTDPAGLSKRIFGADQPTKGNGVSSDSMGQKTTFGPNGVNSTNTTRDSSGGVTSGGSVSSTGNTQGLGNREPASLSSLQLPANFGTIKQQIARENVRVAMVELEENQKYLDSLQPLIDDLTKRYELSKAVLDKTSERIRELEAKAKDNSIKPEETEELNSLRSGFSARESAVKQAQGDLNSTVRDRRTARKDNTDIQLKIAKNTEELPTEFNLDSIKQKIKDVGETWAETVQEMDANKVLGDGVASILGGITGQLGNSFAAVLSGTKSIKSAVKDMAASVIKSMLDIAAQIAAMQAMKGIMGMMGFGSSMGSWGTSSTPVIGGEIGDIGDIAFTAATGGWVTPAGKLQRFATGGPVTGGVSGRDSVPAMVMPGEYIMKKSAVDAVGVDYLHGLNQATSNVVSSSTPKAAAQQQQGNGVVNVWVVSPDQKPNGMGPKDVVVAISDDINRGGSIKKLIKQVATNQI